MKASLSTHVLILNYNGETLLSKYLPSCVEAAAASRFGCRLSVIENQSTDTSLKVLRDEFPSVNVIVSPQNKVLCSYNDVAAALPEDILIFLNNDIRVDRKFVDGLVEPFLDQEELFFVTPKCLSLAGDRYEGNRTKGGIRFGVYWSTAFFPGYEKNVDILSPTLQGGFGAFDRKKFLELGGYDDLYLPGRLEDADLCFRAYKKGWKCLYQPKSVVYHEGGVSFHKAFGVRETLVINQRNTFLFMWKNLSDKIIAFKCVLWLPLRLAHSLIFGRAELWLGFWRAWKMRGQALERRKRLVQSGLLAAVPDKRIFQSI